MYEVDNNVHLRLIEERKRLGFVQNQIASVCDVAKKTISRWENGAPIPSDKLIILMDHGFDIQYIFLGKRSDLNKVGNEEALMVSENKSETYNNMDQKAEHGSSDPSSKQEDGSKRVDLSTIENIEEATPLNTIELSTIGKAWWEAVSDLSETEKNAVLTLVFDHVIAKFIELNMDKVDGSDQPLKGVERLSTYLNSHGPFSVDSKKAS